MPAAGYERRMAEPETDERQSDDDPGGRVGIETTGSGLGTVFRIVNLSPAQRVLVVFGCLLLEAVLIYSASRSSDPSVGYMTLAACSAIGVVGTIRRRTARSKQDG
jgi:hypothetical protein